MHHEPRKHGASMIKILVKRPLGHEEGEALVKALEATAQEQLGEEVRVKGTGIEWDAHQDLEATMAVILEFSAPLGAMSMHLTQMPNPDEGTPIVEGLEAMLRAQQPEQPPSDDERPPPGQYL